MLQVWFSKGKTGARVIITKSALETMVAVLDPDGQPRQIPKAGRLWFELSSASRGARKTKLAIAAISETVFRAALLYLPDNVETYSTGDKADVANKIRLCLEPVFVSIFVNAPDRARLMGHLGLTDDSDVADFLYGKTTTVQQNPQLLPASQPQQKPQQKQKRLQQQQRQQYPAFSIEVSGTTTESDTDSELVDPMSGPSASGPTKRAFVICDDNDEFQTPPTSPSPAPVDAPVEQTPDAPVMPPEAHVKKRSKNEVLDQFEVIRVAMGKIEAAFLANLRR